MKCYVYGHFDPVTGVPLYIGKGTNDRDAEHFHAGYRQGVKKQCEREGKSYPGYYEYLDMIPAGRALPVVRRLLTGLDDVTAYTWEHFFIQAVGRRNSKDNPGPLYNCLAGGRGRTRQDALDMWSGERGIERRRACSPVHRKNALTQGPKKGRRFRGVQKHGKSYVATLRSFGDQFRSPALPTEEAAARFYDILALEHFGPDAYLNFPEGRPA